MGDCWSDTYLDPFHKIMFGFVKPTVVTAANADYTLYSFDPAHPERYNVLKIPTANPKEYFLIENREFVGFDTNLNKSSKNGGILIWHIDESMLVDGSPRNFFDIEEANEGILGYSQLDSGTEIDPANGVYRDPFFYLGGQRIFSPWSTPGTQLYSGGQGNFTVIVKSEPGEAMVVNVQLL